MNTESDKKHCPECGNPVPPDAPQGLCPHCVLAAAASEPGTGSGAPGRFVPPSIEKVREAFPQLERIEQIGAGGMGIVYKARQPRLDRTVALKVLPHSLAGSPAFAERFHREARVLARLNHPNIVTIYDFGEAGGFFYFLMEYVDGVNLRQAMRAGRFSPAQALALVPKICEALQFAHDEGILHRDIKPENILLDSKGRVKIADFGIAKLAGEPAGHVTLTSSGAVLGSAHYMAPEQLESPSNVDHRADIYSLGVVFYELLTGELPLGRFAPPSTKTELDERVDEVVLRALARERELRQQSAKEVKTELESATSRAGSGEAPVNRIPGAGSAPSESASGAASRPDLPGWAAGVSWLMALAALVAFGATLWRLLRPDEPGLVQLSLHAEIFLLLTSIALWTRNTMWRVAATLANILSFLTLAMAAVWLAAFYFGWHDSVVISRSANPVLGIVRTLLPVLALWTLWHRNVRPAFESASPDSVATAALTRPQFSQLAIWGSALVALSLVSAVPLLILISLTVPAFQRGEGGIGPVEIAILTVFGILAIGPAIIGTLFGLTAWGEIRRGAGHLRGKAAAIFASLAWPVLIGLVVIPATLLLVPYFMPGDPSPASDRPEPAPQFEYRTPESNFPEETAPTNPVPAGPPAMDRAE